ncbi:hypothetical protein AAFF_G00289550 [Aldrovandia affinis]|uniref:Uncharacterized protein n=1 Tax=Aldrovandia affinis TaxID=143900 RepID=A0AAD7R9H8_9TELE|nr:hypothetical protein AAFF_G00289550 [Aldrovandia affinis]
MGEFRGLGANGSTAFQRFSPLCQKAWPSPPPACRLAPAHGVRAQVNADTLFCTQSWRAEMGEFRGLGANGSTAFQRFSPLCQKALAFTTACLPSGSCSRAMQARVIER